MAHRARRHERPARAPTSRPGVTIMPPAFVNIGAWVGRGLDGRLARPRRLVRPDRPRRPPRGRGPGRRRARAARAHARSSSRTTRSWAAAPGSTRASTVGRGAVIGAGVILTGQSRLIDLVEERELRGTPDAPLRRARRAASSCRARGRPAARGRGSSGIVAVRAGHRQAPRRGDRRAGGAGGGAPVSAAGRARRRRPLPAHRGRRDAWRAMTRRRCSPRTAARSTSTTSTSSGAAWRCCARRCPSSAELAFAVKANPSPLVLETLRCGRASAPTWPPAASWRPSCGRASTRAAVCFTGPGKTDAEIEAALRARIRALTIESLDELEARARHGDAGARRARACCCAWPRGRRGRGAAHHRGGRERQVRPDRRRGRRGARPAAPARRAADPAAASGCSGFHAFGASNVLEARGRSSTALRDLAARAEALAGDHGARRPPARRRRWPGHPVRGRTARAGRRRAGGGHRAPRWRPGPAARRCASARVLLEPGRWLVGPGGRVPVRGSCARRSASGRDDRDHGRRHPPPGSARPRRASRSASCRSGWPWPRRVRAGRCDVARRCRRPALHRAWTCWPTASALPLSAARRRPRRPRRRRLRLQRVDALLPLAPDPGRGRHRRPIGPRLPGARRTSLTGILGGRLHAARGTARYPRVAACARVRQATRGGGHRPGPRTSQ